MGRHQDHGQKGQGGAAPRVRNDRARQHFGGTGVLIVNFLCIKFVSSFPNEPVCLLAELVPAA
jgi:hypothetical protein